MIWYFCYPNLNLEFQYECTGIPDNIFDQQLTNFCFMIWFCIKWLLLFSCWKRFPNASWVAKTSSTWKTCWWCESCRFWWTITPTSCPYPLTSRQLRRTNSSEPKLRYTVTWCISIYMYILYSWLTCNCFI